MKRCILLLVDGLHPTVGEGELQAGRLPNLATLTASGGRGRAITSFPSTTSVSYLPFLTGCFPGRANVPSIRWLDRSRYKGRWWTDREAVRSYCGYQAGMLDRDIAPDAETIFERIPESAAFFTMITRGLRASADPTRGARKFWGAVSHYLGWHQPGDDVVGRHLLQWIERDQGWRFLFAQFPAVDGYTHQSRPDSPAVLGALHRVDRSIGLLTAALDRRRLTDDTLILVVSDHGASVVEHHLDLAPWLRRRGIRTLAHPELWRRDPTAAVMVAGNGSAMIYARPNDCRADRLTMAQLREPTAFGSQEVLVTALLEENAIAFLAAQDDRDTVRVASRAGEALVREVGERIEYRLVTGDPLAIGGPATLDRRAWLTHTFDQEFPDAPVQLIDQFRSPRGGDLLVVARKGFDFRDRWEIPEHKSGHGSMIRDHMQTPLWSSQPLGPIALRTADLYPSILAWLGEPCPAGIDGEPVWRPGEATTRPELEPGRLAGSPAER
jgi:hypothetical protein